jgi:hypothetical protein
MTGRESLVFYKSFNTLFSKHKKKYERDALLCIVHLCEGSSLWAYLSFFLEIEKEKKIALMDLFSELSPVTTLPPPAAYTGTTLTSHTERRQAP